MGIEEFIMYGSSIVLLILIYKLYKLSKWGAVINSVIYLGYTSYMLYGFFYRNQEGAAIGWWISILFFTWVHLLLVIIYLMRYRNKN